MRTPFVWMSLLALVLAVAALAMAIVIAVHENQTATYDCVHTTPVRIECWRR